MADNQSPVQTASSAELLAHLNSTLRSLTDAVLEMRATLSALVEAERAEAIDIREGVETQREIRQYIFRSTEKQAEAAVLIKETRLDLRRLEESGPIRTHSPEDETLEQAKFVVRLARFVKAHWASITVSSGTGAALYHFLQRLFHH